MKFLIRPEMVSMRNGKHDMSIEPAPVRSRSIYPAIFLAAALYICVQTFSVLSPILLSFFLILLVALALNPVVVGLRKLGGRRSFATAFIALTFLILIGLTSWAFYAPVKKSAHQFFQQLPKYWERIQEPLQRLEHRTTAGQSANGKTNVVVVAQPTGEQKGLFHFDSQFLAGISSGLQKLVSNVTAMAIVGVTVFVGTIYTLLNPRPIFTTFFALIPERHHERALRIARRIVDFVPRWALAMLTGMLVIGVMVFCAMWPLFTFQDALVLGLISFVFEAIPYVGPILSGVPALLLASGEGGFTPLWVVIAYIGIQLFEHNVISPVIVAGQLRQHPLAVIFSVLFCVAAFGVLGILLAVPLVSVLQILHDELYRPRFLPTVSDEELGELAGSTLKQNVAPSDAPGSEAAARDHKKSVRKSNRIDD